MNFLDAASWMCHEDFFNRESNIESSDNRSHQGQNRRKYSFAVSIAIAAATTADARGNRGQWSTDCSICRADERAQRNCQHPDQSDSGVEVGS
jgi:hypothetical protein